MSWLDSVSLIFSFGIGGGVLLPHPMTENLEKNVCHKIVRMSLRVNAKSLLIWNSRFWRDTVGTVRILKGKMLAWGLWLDLALIVP